jgi:branched-chain amino acid transport system substrate-binding protein
VANNLRERLVIVLTTASVLATVGLGSAAAYALTHGGTATVALQGSQALAAAAGTPTPGGPGAAATSAPTAAASASGAQGGSTTTTTTGGGGQHPVAGVNNTNNFIHGGTITVGGIFDESGPLDATVERDTVRAYFNKVNAAGGVNGYKLQLIDCDSQFNPSQAHTCAQRLLAQGVLAIVGWTSVSGEQTEAPYLDTQTSSCPQCGVPIFGGLGVDAEFQSPLSFPVADPLGRQGYAGGSRSCQLGYQHTAVVYLTAAFAASVNNGVLKGLATCGQHPSGNDDVGVDLSSQQDYTSVIAPWRADGTASVLAALDPFSIARLYQAMESQQWQVPLSAAGLDKTTAEGAYGSYFKGAQSLTAVLEPVGHMDNPAVADYLNTVKQYYPDQVSKGNLDVYTEEQWIAAHVFVQALSNIHGPVTRQALVQAAQNLTNFDTGGLTEPLSYGRGANNDPNHWVEWMHNANGTANGWVTDSDWVQIPYNPF